MSLPTHLKQKCKRLSNLSENWKSREIQINFSHNSYSKCQYDAENDEFANNIEHISCHFNKSCVAKPQSHNQESLVKPDSSIFGQQFNPTTSTKGFQCNIQMNIRSVGSNTRLLNRDVTVQVDTSSHSDDKLPSTKCEEINSLICNGTFASFLEEIQNSKQTDAFCSLVRSIANGSLPTENIAWKSTLYRGKWSSLSSTHRIRFDTEYSDFWGIMKLLFGTSVINVLRGPAYFGKIVTDEVQRNKFDPSSAPCNFAILSSRTLHQFSTGYDKVMPLGMITHTLDVAEAESKYGEQYTLMFNGKYVAEGFRGDRDGDVDLWGHETDVSVKEALVQRDFLIENMSRIGTPCVKTQLPLCIENIQCIMTQILQHIKKL